MENKLLDSWIPKKEKPDLGIIDDENLRQQVEEIICGRKRHALGMNGRNGQFVQFRAAEEECAEFIGDDDLSAEVRSINCDRYLIVYGKTAQDVNRGISEVSFLDQAGTANTSLYGNLVIFALDKRNHLADMRSDDYEDIENCLTQIFYPVKASNGIARPYCMYALNGCGPYTRYLESAW